MLIANLVPPLFLPIASLNSRENKPEFREAIGRQ